LPPRRAFWDAHAAPLAKAAPGAFKRILEATT
jgi:hypothetical protein